ncbi:MAG: alpha/beta hydrolase [Archangium gephyra]|uniref:Alpha/beta hydrolase n=1 Tax=Archangium gephyra TaxID=48 RepID=A0A2W5TXT4_9BACT|nr:MAG: alpha/beta hydrolase [Archangium gephyra]
MTSVMFKSPAAREKIEQWHQRFRERIPAPLESRTVGTRFGDSHMLIGGPASAPPLVVLHGALASSSHLLLELSALLKTFRVYAIDVIGQSVKSADVRLRVDNDDYGTWLGEVLDQLKLEKVRLIGVSWGGFVAQHFTAVAPERIEKLALLVPAGMVSGSAWAGFWKTGWPMSRYLLSPSPTRLRKFAQGLLTTFDDDWLPYIGDSFLIYRLNMKVPSLSKPEEFKHLTAPVLVIAAEHDVSFPGQAVLERSKQLFKAPDTELLRGSQHSPPTTAEFRAWMGERLTTFFI